MSEAAPQSTTRANNKVVGYITAILAAVLVYLLMDAGSIELLSVSVPVWLVAIVSYALGAGALWGFSKK